MKLINGMTVRLENGQFRFSVYSGIKVFAIKESYAVTGEEAHFPRRDLRRGAATGEPHAHTPCAPETPVLASHRLQLTCRCWS